MNTTTTPTREIAAQFTCPRSGGTITYRARIGAEGNPTPPLDRFMEASGWVRTAVIRGQTVDVGWHAGQSLANETARSRALNLAQYTITGDEQAARERAASPAPVPAPAPVVALVCTRCDKRLEIQQPAPEKRAAAAKAAGYVFVNDKWFCSLRCAHEAPPVTREQMAAMGYRSAEPKPVPAKRARG